MRVQILKDFVKHHFTSTQLLDYALDVEKITTSKVRFQAQVRINYWLVDWFLYCRGNTTIIMKRYIFISKRRSSVEQFLDILSLSSV